MEQAASDGVFYPDVPSVPVQPLGDPAALLCNVQAVQCYADVGMVRNVPRLAEPLGVEHFCSCLLHFLQQFPVMLVRVSHKQLKQLCEQPQEKLAEFQVS